MISNSHGGGDGSVIVTGAAHYITLKLFRVA